MALSSILQCASMKRSVNVSRLRARKTLPVSGRPPLVTKTNRARSVPAHLFLLSAELLEAIASGDRHVAIATSFLAHAFQESGCHINKLAALFNVLRHALPQFFELLRVLGGKSCYANPGNGQARWPPSGQEQNCPGRKRPNHQRFLPIHCSALHCCVLWLKL